jgi:hypothetical protein
MGREPACAARATLVSSEDGAAILEFALVLPILFGLLAGCFELGRALLVRQAMLDGVRGGTRTLARLPDPTCLAGCSPRAGQALALTQSTIARGGRLRPEAVAVTPGWDPATRMVALTAEVRLEIELLSAIGMSPTLGISVTHREAWVAD